MSMANAIPAMSLDEAMQAADVKPLWVHYKELGSPAPNRMEPVMHWRWEALSGVVGRVSAEIGMEEAERRVLVLANPAFETIQTTRNLIGALQILNPGDSAHEHRHTMSALRMILDAGGGFTSVDGEPYEMQNGDLILTPAWTWHGHDNNTAGRVVWFDGLDVPFVRNVLDACFFEHGPPADPQEALPDLAERYRWADHGLVGAGERAEKAPHSPRIRFPWSSTTAKLDRLEPAACGNVIMRYVNPQTGGAVLPTIDCLMMRVLSERFTRRRRTTSSTICVVVDGEGVSQIGDDTVIWKKNDIFVVPHWTWAAHRTTSATSHLFMMSDAEIYRRVGLFREENEAVEAAATGDNGARAERDLVEANT